MPGQNVYSFSRETKQRIGRIVKGYNGGIYSNIRISPWKNPHQVLATVFSFRFSRSFDLFLVSDWIFSKRNTAKKLSHTRKKRSIVRKKGWGSDDTEGSMIEVRENVHERGKRKGRKVVERRDWRCIVRATYLTETLRSCERREHIGEQQYPISLTIASMDRSKGILRYRG